MTQWTTALSQQETPLNCTKFAALSGDFNPLHLNASYAYKTMFGKQVVYGLLQVFRALENLADKKSALFITKINAEFRTSLEVGEEFAIDFDENAGRCKIKIVDRGGNIVSKIDLLYEEVAENILTKKILGSAPAFGHFDPDVVLERKNLKFTESLDYNHSLLAQLFPHISTTLHELNVGALLMITRVVGMKYPGLNSIFKGFELTFDHNEGESSCSCEVTQADSLFNECEIEITSNNIRGSLQAFFRPDIPKQHDIHYLAEHDYNIDGLKDHKALVIGGSRGIGAQCARILALSGCNVLFTYYKSEDEAAALQSEIASFDKGQAKYIQLDSTHVSDSAKQAIADFAPSSIYYFATPKITANNSKSLNDNLYKSYVNTYLFSLDKIVNICIGGVNS